MLINEKSKLIEAIIAHNVLTFGEFTLKSGRISPYFFNSGALHTGALLKLLGNYYAQEICQKNLAFDVIFGPAYKGIPLASGAAMALSELTQQPVPYAFNRKEPKQHGEGGRMVGSAVAGNVLIIDDVITAGTAIRQSIELIVQSQAIPVGVVVIFDRQERGTATQYASGEITEKYGIPVISLITIEDIMAYLAQQASQDTLTAIQRYRAQYG